jgi:predicted nucleic acid-binding protein
MTSVVDGALFVDTNVFAYALDEGEPVKRDAAREVIEKHRRQIIVSTQVLLELYAVCTRKLGMDRAVAGGAVRAVALFPVVSADRELILDTIALAARAQLSVFDAAIVSAAVRGGCATVLTEDLNEGQVLSGVRVHNPF